MGRFWGNLWGRGILRRIRLIMAARFIRYSAEWLDCDYFLSNQIFIFNLRKCKKYYLDFH